MHASSIKWNTIRKKKQHRYKILCIKKIQEPCTPEKTARIILDHVNLPEDQFRLGQTKVEQWISSESLSLLYSVF